MPITLDQIQRCLNCSTKLKKGKYKCHICLTWNPPGAGKIGGIGNLEDGTVLLHEVDDGVIKYLQSGPWDTNFADPSGVPDDCVAIVGGEPGAGKSTLALQWADALAIASGKESLYLCAEESKQQVKARSVRLGLMSKRIRIVPMEKMGEVNLETIIGNRSLGGLVLDSVAMFTDNMDKAVEIVTAFKSFAIAYRMPHIIINHVTKDGDMAGSMKLQHAGDISLMLTKSDKDEVDKVRFAGMDDEDDWFDLEEMRELRTEKSRYGPSGISTFYAMTGRGLIEVEREEDMEEEDGDEEDE